MGHNSLKAANAGNPLGFYEDALLVEATKGFYSAGAWLRDFAAVHVGCTNAGFKSPELAFVEIHMLQPRAVFVTNRNLFDVARSLLKWHAPKPVTETDAYYVAARYMCGIYDKIDYCRHLTHIVNTTERRDEDELTEELRDFLRLRGVSG